MNRCLKTDPKRRIKSTSVNMINIVDKHKKWVQISWKDGAECFSGWVQNWKLSEFK